MSSAPADLLPRARIRLAALELFGAQGFDKTTIRQIASRAGVSPGLVIHHFGSKTQLRRTVDDWIGERVLDDRQVMMAGAFMPRMTDYLAQHPELAPMLTYLITALREDSPIAQRMFDRIYEMTAEVLQLGAGQGMIREFDDTEAVTTLITAFSVGLCMFSHRVAVKLGGQSLLDPEPLRRYAINAVELFTNGLFSDDTYLRMTAAAFADSEKEDDIQRDRDH